MYKTHSNLENFNHKSVTIFLEDKRWHPITREGQDGTEHVVVSLSWQHFL
jgi:hypothetical protein